ncbi:NAD-dependent epimerase/dehydratase [Nitrobacter hamburgensis X14]|uniref:NAD-dependent epimerase/dehydratase n=2 Tax=Nitrobacter hamburgensis TaxID=912 RepID=Q1QJM7_NITHX|nr:NAD-dependent epimerase/dehydratase [Nitrobacter hamburgensis X14]
MMSSQRSIVLGGTGLVGSHIVRQLVMAGERPLTLSRRPRTDDHVDWLQGDLARPADLALPLVEQLFCTVNIQLLADALPCVATPSLRRVVVFTSTSIVTKANSEIESEREGVRRLAEGEQRLIAVCDRLGIGWTILRPTLIYDEGRDANITRLAGLIGRFGFLPLLGGGTGLRQPVHAEDLAIGALAAMAAPAAANKTYVLAGCDVMTYREMVGRIFDGMARSRRLISVPPWVWRAAFLAMKPMLPHANVEMGIRMAQDMNFDSSAAQADFGWNPRGFHPQFLSR